MKFDWIKLVSWIPFNQGKPKIQAGVAIIILTLVLGLATKCHAAEQSYVQFGVGSTMVRGQSMMMDLSVVYPELGPGDSTIEFGTTFIGASELNGVQRNNFAWHAALVDGFGRFDVGIGPAYLQNMDTYNGSNLNYMLLVGYRFQKWPVTLRAQHFSNGGTRSPNKGRDMLFLAWRF